MNKNKQSKTLAKLLMLETDAKANQIESFGHKKKGNTDYGT